MTEEFEELMELLSDEGCSIGKVQVQSLISAIAGNEEILDLLGELASEIDDDDDDSEPTGQALLDKIEKLKEELENS